MSNTRSGSNTASNGGGIVGVAEGGDHEQRSSINSSSADQETSFGTAEMESMGTTTEDDDDDDDHRTTTTSSSYGGAGGTQQSASDDVSEGQRRQSQQQQREPKLHQQQQQQLAAEPTQEGIHDNDDDNQQDGNNNSNSVPLPVAAATTTTTSTAAAPKPAVVTTTASPFSLYAVSDQSRNELHSKFRAYEARRRSIYTAKLESSSLYWRSFRDLLQASIHETGRAERVVLGTTKACDKYAAAMQAMYEDVFLDDKGNVVQTQRQQQQLAKQRTDEEANLLTNLSQNNKSTHNTATTTTMSSSTSSNKDRQSILHTLLQSQSVMATKFRENSQHVEDAIARDIVSLKNNMQQKVNEIETIGNAILAELEKTEHLVQQAWDAYYTTAIRGLSNGGGTSSNAARRAGAAVTSEEEKQQGAPGSQPADSNAIVDNCSDVWLVEMHYRVAVHYQTSTWDKGSAELSKLFSSMKDAECHRRIQLRDLLLAFVQRQQLLFLSLPDVHTPVLQDLVSRQMDHAAVEEQVQQAIRRRAHMLQRQAKDDAVAAMVVSSSSSFTSQPGGSAGNFPTGLGAAAAPGAAATGPGLTGVNEDDGNFKIESPLMSGLLCRAKVIEKRSAGMMQGWKTALAVVTADSFLHLFDLPSASVKPGTAPEVAFASLVPQIQVPAAGAVKSTKIFSGYADHPLTPSDSLALANCSITTSIQDIKWFSFEVTEKVYNKGASKVFSKTAMKSFKLRMLTRADMEEWISVLQAQK